MKSCWSENGSAILEQVFAGLVLAIGGLALASYLTNSMQSSVKTRGYSSQDKILDTVRTSALLTSSIRNSYVFDPSNSALESCVTQQPSFGVANTTLRDCVTGVKVPFTLYGPLVANGGSLTSGAVAGTQSKPVLYDLTGQTCAVANTTNNQISSKGCVLQAWTEFAGQCPSAIPLGPPAKKCDVAETIQVFYHIEPIPGAPVGSAPFTPIVGNVSVSVRQVSGEPPSIDTVYPTPTPVPDPTPGPSPSPGSGPGPSPTPTAIPAQIFCPGDTIQFGNSCACPPGNVLIDIFGARCEPVGI